MNDPNKRETDAACEDEALRAVETPEDRRGDQAGDPQRGGRLPTAEGGAGEGGATDGGETDDREPRPADDAARSGIPSRSFNL